ncbi:hypothetical protein DFH07DRAFT_776749 [Mycena maculata]|uniref:Uncharacterized protein n=1 Tax=Mycena maculata TaxID=230809 RepID=A0AAD7N4I1_9AGAR|nr:hypothetical protein DFH07DRAFT_776749 [Mycena maculata]
MTAVHSVFGALLRYSWNRSNERRPGKVCGGYTYGTFAATFAATGTCQKCTQEWLRQNELPRSTENASTGFECSTCRRTENPTPSSDGSSPMVGTRTYQPAPLIVRFGGTLHGLRRHPSELSWLKTRPSSGMSSPMGIMPMVKPAFVPSPINSRPLTAPLLPFAAPFVAPFATFDHTFPGTKSAPHQGHPPSSVTPTNEPTSAV